MAARMALRFRPAKGRGLRLNSYQTCQSPDSLGLSRIYPRHDVVRNDLPTGTVTFFDGATSIGQGTLSTTGGVSTASFSTTTLSAANHVIMATYNGDKNFNVSTSAAER